MFRRVSKRLNLRLSQTLWKSKRSSINCPSAMEPSRLRRPISSHRSPLPWTRQSLHQASDAHPRLTAPTEHYLLAASLRQLWHLEDIVEYRRLDQKRTHLSWTDGCGQIRQCHNATWLHTPRALPTPSAVPGQIQTRRTCIPTADPRRETHLSPICSESLRITIVIHGQLLMQLTSQHGQIRLTPSDSLVFSVLLCHLRLEHLNNQPRHRERPLKI